MACFVLFAGGVRAQETTRVIEMVHRVTTNTVWRSGDPSPLPSADPAEVGMDTAQLARIDQVMAKAMDDRQVSGGVVLVARKGRTVFEKAYGYRSVVPTTEPATLDTIYDLASLTKPTATATAIMKLAEQGKLRLNDPVSAYLPEWKNTPEEKARLQEIARLKRLVAQGGVKLNPNMLVIGDIKTTPITGKKGPKETPAQLWKKAFHDGRIRLNSRFVEDVLSLDDFDREEVTLRQLLTHTAGLDPYDNYYQKFPGRESRKAVIQNIAQRKLQQRPGEKFVYSDLGYITLGEIAERVSGMDLNTFLRREVYGPLGMRDTMYCPPAELLPRIAPTEWRTEPGAGAEKAVKGKKSAPANERKYMIRGEVHDGNALVQNGISGHAGLFSTARDLSVFCQMLLNGGQYDGVLMFSPLTVRAMTTDQAQLPGGEKRGFGWDIRSQYSGQRGDLLPSGFGHTGWTGTSIWVVPEEQLFIIILTNRVHPDGSGDAGPLRSKIANVVAGSILQPLSASPR